MTETSSMELPVLLTDNDLMLLNEVDEYVDRSLISGDLRSVLKFGRVIKRNMQISGVAFAKLLTRINDHWDQYTSAGIEDDFVDVMYSELGSAPATTRKYIAMWRAIFDNNTIPEDVKKQLLGRPVKSLLVLTAAANEGSVEWQEVLETSTHAEVQQVVRAARGKATSSSTRITIKLMRTGELVAYRENDRVPLGYLMRDPSNDINVKAIDRIVNSSGILED